MNAGYQRLVENLVLATDASRTTLRLDSDAGELAVVAEAVRHGADKIGEAPPIVNLRATPTVQHLTATQMPLVQNDLQHADPPVPNELLTLYKARAQMLAPLLLNGRLAGVISVHDVRGPREWSDVEIADLEQARQDATALLEASAQRTTSASETDLQDAAVNAILETLRESLRASRCTLRQDVLAAFAFPVTHESRAPGVRSLRGDLTIPQNNQPVIEHMLMTREQVVQDDSASTFSNDPAFAAMLQHYGGMRSQIVTPIFAGDKMQAVLSIHDLNAPRKWTDDEIQLAADASRLLAAVVIVRETEVRA